MKNFDLQKWAGRTTIAGVSLSTMAFAVNSGLSSVGTAMNQICNQLMQILPPLAMLLVILAAIFYASGKLVPNPEFSGRASGLAAGAVAAAVICLVMVMILPGIIGIIYNNNPNVVACGTP